MEDGLEGEAEARVAVRDRWTPETVTLEEALAAAVAAARRRRRRRRRARSPRRTAGTARTCKKGTDSRSLESEEQLFTVTLAEAEAIFAQPKQRRGRAAKPPLAELGAHPESGAPVRVLDGRFGPYVTDGTVNATVPRGIDPESVTLEQAVELLRERAPRGAGHEEGARRRRPAKKAGEEDRRQEVDRQEGARRRSAAAKKAAAKKAASTADAADDEAACSGT